jgi:hypothetical protein
MSKDEEPKGKPVAIDPNAISASPTKPAFVAPPKGAPVYHGFVVLEDVSVEGFTFGAITDFEASRVTLGMPSSLRRMAVAPGLCGKSRDRVHRVHRGSATFRARQMGCLGSLVPVPYGQPRKCSQESGGCVTRIESSLGAMEALAFSSRVGSTVVTSR